MLIYALLFALFMACFIKSTLGFLEAYEAAVPEHYMDAYVLSLKGDKITEAALNADYTYDEKLVSLDTMTELFISDFPSEVSYKKNAVLSTDGKAGYDLISGGQKIGSVVIYRLPEAESGTGLLFDRLWNKVKEILGCSFGAWAVESERFIYSPQAGRQSVTVPETWSVYCGDRLLNEEYVTDTGKIQAFSELYDEYELPMLKTYTVEKFSAGAKLRTFNNAGSEIELSGDSEADEQIFLAELFPTDADELKTATERFLELYIAYCSGARGDRRDNLKALRKVLVKDSDLDKRMVQAYDGQYYTHSKGDVIEDLKFNLILAGNGNGMADISYTLITTGNAGAVSTENNMRVYFVDSNKGYLAEKIMVY